MFLLRNPFFDAYYNTDFLGKLIFIALLVASVCSWVILIHKWLITSQIKRNSNRFRGFFLKQKGNPLHFKIDQFKMDQKQESRVLNPFFDLYLELKRHSVGILNKNLRYLQEKEGGQTGNISYLSPTDLDFVESYMVASISTHTKHLEKNLYILSTVTTLAPFLGLLGTVWGILTSFSEMQANHMGSQAVLGGLSMALATTVLGLFIAIPALIGYNYLKAGIRDYAAEMENFSTELISSVEMQYRKVDLQ